MKGRISVGKCPASYHRLAYTILLGLLALGAICLGRQEPSGRREPSGRQKPPGRQPSRPRRATLTRRLKTIQLPEPGRSGAVAFERALVEQRSVQLPGSQRLEFTKIGQLAWAAQGVMAPSSATTVPPATTPSTVTPPGSIPMPPEIVGMKVYFVMPDGAYLYDPVAHGLQQISDGDVRESLAAALLNQPGAPTGGCQVILAGSSRDFIARFGAQARTVMLLQAGRMAQNIELQAVALGLTFISTNNAQGARVRKVVRLARNLDPLYVAFVGYPPGEAPQAPATEPVGGLTGRALLVLPPSGYHDEEYFQTKRALELAGVQVAVASTRMEPITGMLGGTAQANVLLRQASADNYDAVIFIGGLGAASYFNDPAALNLARQAAMQRKVLAAIGTAPSILASATVLRSVRSTAYISEQNRLTLAGAIYTGNPAEKDGLIITATGPLAVALFTQAILDGLGELGRP